MKIRRLIFLSIMISMVNVLHSNVVIDKSPKKNSDKRSYNKSTDWVTLSVDDMTNDTTYKSIDYIEVPVNVKDKGFLIRMEKYGYDGSPWIMFETFGSGECIDNKNRVIILFSDKTKIDTEGSSKFNCKNVCLIKISEEDSELLKSKNIEKVRVYTVNGSVEETFSKKQSEDFRITFKYLVESR
jgi:hypothetical protein